MGRCMCYKGMKTHSRDLYRRARLLTMLEVLILFQKCFFRHLSSSSADYVRVRTATGRAAGPGQGQCDQPESVIGVMPRQWQQL